MTTFATATTVAATPHRTRSRAANVALWTLQVLLAAVYAFSAFGKLSAEAQNVAGFQAMGLGNTGMYIIGSLELAGAIAMFIPRLTGLAATCFVALMIGAVTMTLAIGGGALAVIPATVLVLAAVVAWGRRDSTRRLIHDVTGR
jgi:DoxX-like protein